MKLFNIHRYEYVTDTNSYLPYPGILRGKFNCILTLLGALGARSVFSAIGDGVMKGMLPASCGLGVSRGKNPKLKLSFTMFLFK